ncbi:MAG: SRPBCC family protein [Magnetospirillum sp.]|nr:SRPBCC family protein [Magnetospirillum sp.]
MLKLLAIVLFGLVVAVGALVAYAATKPDSFRVVRSLTIAAPPDRLFALINDMRGFNRWNPYERKDPGRGTYGSAQAGIGASYAWDSPKLGKGAMTIVDAAAPGRVVMRLDFETPFKARNSATFTIMPHDGGSEVSWAMEGPAPLVTKVMDTVIGMDKIIGGDFEEGLRNLKEIAEKP